MEWLRRLLTKTLSVSAFAAEEASHALSGKCRFDSGVENEIKIFFYFLSFIQLVTWTLLIKLLGLTHLKWNRKHLVRTKGCSLLRRQAVKWDWFSFYMNRQVHWLSFGGLRVHGQQCVRQFGSTLTPNACEHCVHLEANYVTSDHRLASSPEKFSAVVMSGNSWSCLLVRGT